MKVVHFYTGNLVGGVEKLLIDLFEYQLVLDPGELEAIFVLCYEGYLSRKLRERGAIVEVIPTPKLSHPWTLFRTFFNLKKILSKHGVNTIVSHEIWNHGVAWPIAKILGVRNVLWIHSSSFRFDIPLYRYLGYYKPDIAICTSHHVKISVTNLWPNMKAQFVYPPYARPTLQTKPIEPKKEITLIYVGRMVEYKGFSDIVEALGMIKDANFCLIAVGSAETEQQLIFMEKTIQRIKELGLQNKIKFVGFQENIFDFMTTADVFVHPNKLPEPLGFVFIEALFSEVPIVATNIGGAKEILEMQSSKMGDLVPPGDINELALILKKYIENDDYRMQIKNNISRDFFNVFDPKISMKKLSDILHSL